MPDVAAAERFIGVVAKLEARATRNAAQVLQGHQAEFLAQLARDPQSIMPLVRRVGAQLALALAPVGSDATQAAAAYAAAQLGDVAGFVPENGNQAVWQPFATGLPSWQAATAGRFLADAARLQAAGLSGDALALALMATNADQQSAWQWALNALRLAADATTWQATNGALAASYRAAEQESGEHYQKQAIAAIDSRTTECCLKVHGQIVDLDARFTLTGRPRFASQLAAPPFHYRCRTVIALHTPSLENTGILTISMRARAREEIAARRSGR